ncbi:6323_t:CDS:2 [Funneliformis caledonium]|uniref:6323_t:CDS:1 n=1 Tax=Funneliformis caledonium TaxID=1117310 RepID=A0A9N9AAU7_9GLOM|nr:6323_t:CDS:2 [Funneliformis caledonium]
MSLETSSGSFMPSTDIGRNIKLNMFHTRHCSKPQDTANLILLKRSLRIFLHFTFAYVLQQEEEWRLAYILFQLMNLFYTKNKSYSPGRCEAYRWGFGILPSGLRKMPLIHSDSFEELCDRSAGRANGWDSSNDNANVDQETGMILFTLFIKLFTMDVFQQSEIPLDITDPEDREMFALIRLRRPLGYSYLESNKKNPRHLRNLIEHFKIKLLGEVDDLTRADITRANIAIVSLLACLEISSQLTLASDLIASHAAICYAISEDRENLLVGYSSEPLLAEVGFFLIEDKGNLVKVLKTFNDSLKKGIVEPGPREEFVA